MKLLYCNKCNDIFLLRRLKRKECNCGESWGYYVDGLNARYGGDCTPLGIHNSSFECALKIQLEEKGRGAHFTAFVISKKCRTFVKVEKASCNHEACKLHQQILEEEGENDESSSSS